MITKFNVSGISFRVREQKELALAKPIGACTVALDPENKYAKHARGAFPVTWNGMNIGFVPDSYPELQDYIVKLIDSGEEPQLRVKEYCYKDKGGFNNDDKGKLAAVTLVLLGEGDDLTIPKAETKTPVAVDGMPTDKPYVKLKSFNEDGVEVLFFADGHTYWYEGKQLASVTRAVGLMYEKFDAKRVSGFCEKKYGMKSTDIMDLWARNGDASSGFGTAMHAYMENYQLYGERALPKIPMLSDIVTSFPWVSNTVHTEVLITSVKRGICGLCDRLMVNGDVHTVCDFKFSGGISDIDKNQANKLYPDLPKNKVTKAVVQESLYSEMLGEAGLKVSDTVVVHSWAGSWVHYRENRVKGILGKVAG